MISSSGLVAQAPPEFRYFHDDSGQLFRALDSTGTLLEYVYDPAGNILQINRSTVPPTSLSVLNLSPRTGTSGDTFVIEGQNFSTTPSANTVQINGFLATVVSATSTRLVVNIPSGVTSGPVTITVNGVTVSSGTLLFNATASPAITSLTPDGGLAGASLASVAVQGSSLTNATYQLSAGGGIVTSATPGGPSAATLALTAGTLPGVYDIVATTDTGVSTTGPGSKFTVLPAKWEAAVSLSVLNVISAVPGENAAESILSVLNVQSSLPGKNAAESILSVLNNASPPNSNFAESSLLSVNNQSTGMISQRMTNTAGDARLLPPTSADPVLRGLKTTVIAGETVRLAVEQGTGIREVEFQVNGTVFATVSEAPFEMLFVVPAGVEQIQTSVVARGLDGAEWTTQSAARVLPAQAGKLTGHVALADSTLVPGARVSLRGAGLRAEYFDFERPLTGLPDVAGLVPASRGFLSSLNLRNPREVFGKDPLGLGMAPDYAARFTGEVWIETPGEHHFFLRSHAGSRLKIGVQTIVDVPAGASESEEGSGSATLERGWHEIEVEFYETVGAATVQLDWQRPDWHREAVDPRALSTGELWSGMSDAAGAFAVEDLPSSLSGFYVEANRTGGEALKIIWE